jgi:hypothetical protein
MLAVWEQAWEVSHLSKRPEEQCAHMQSGEWPGARSTFPSC